MFGELHDLHHELPQHKDKIHELKMNNNHFKRLFEEYNELVHEMTRIQQNIETPSDEVVESLKLKRLHLKDELNAMLMVD